jgi:hypothetical protein
VAWRIARLCRDGVAALARAFFHAGTASTVAGVWDVVDAPTSPLPPAFHRAWLGGADTPIFPGRVRPARGAEVIAVAIPAVHARTGRSA